MNHFTSIAIEMSKEINDIVMENATFVNQEFNPRLVTVQEVQTYAGILMYGGARLVRQELGDPIYKAMKQVIEDRLKTGRPML